MKNFNEFMKRTLDNLEDAPYLQDLFENLDQFYEDLINGKSPRLIVNMPPRSLKSESISIRLPSYIHSKNPYLDIGVFVSNHDLADRFSKKNKEIFSRSNKNNLKYFGLNIDCTCWKFDLIIIDDSIRNILESDSLKYKYRTNTYIKKLLEQHLNPGGGFINVQSRWCKDDTTGFLTNVCNDNMWKVLNYPAFQNNRYNLEEIRKYIPHNFFQALYQQEPVI